MVDKSLKSVLMLVLIFSLFTSCGVKNESLSTVEYETTVDGQIVVISYDKRNNSTGTVTANNYTCTYEYAKDGRLKISYPDGSSFTYFNYTGYGSPTSTYPNGISLAWAIEDAIESSSKNSNAPNSNFFIGLLIIAVGALNLFGTKRVWWLSHGWKYKDAEPSELALAIYQFSGGLCIFAGVICVISSF